MKSKFHFKIYKAISLIVAIFIGIVLTITVLPSAAVASNHETFLPSLTVATDF